MKEMQTIRRKRDKESRRQKRDAGNPQKEKESRRQERDADNLQKEGQGEP
jgi:hypothetical protein